MFPSEEAAAYYLSAMIDGEGSVARESTAFGRYHTRVVNIVNTTPEIITACTKALEQLGIGYRLYTIHRPGLRPIQKIEIGRWENLTTLASCVNLMHPGKAARLAGALNSYRQRPRSSWPPAADLAGLYDSGLSCRAVGERYGVTAEAVKYWMKVYGIPRRHRGHSTRLTFILRRAEIATHAPQGE